MFFERLEVSGDLLEAFQGVYSTEALHKHFGGSGGLLEVQGGFKGIL